MLSMDFKIPRLVSKMLFTGSDGRISTAKVDAFYDKQQVEALRDFPGLKWKIWAVSEDGGRGSGFYLFEDREDALLRKKYAEKYYWRKGMFFVKCRMDMVVEGCSIITRAPIDAPANPAATMAQANEIMRFKDENPIKKILGKYKILKGVE